MSRILASSFMVRKMAKENNDWGGGVNLEHKQGKDR